MVKIPSNVVEVYSYKIPEIPEIPEWVGSLRLNRCIRDCRVVSKTPTVFEQHTYNQKRNPIIPRCIYRGVWEFGNLKTVPRRVPKKRVWDFEIKDLQEI